MVACKSKNSNKSIIETYYCFLRGAAAMRVFVYLLLLLHCFLRNLLRPKMCPFLPILIGSSVMV